jgi:hypothetical protein
MFSKFLSKKSLQLFLQPLEKLDNNDSFVHV